MDWALIVNFATTIVAILNPLGNLLLFIAYTAREPKPVRRILAFLLAITIFFFLLVFLFTGQTILQFFGVSLVAFQIAGGVLLLLIGIGMIQGQTIRSKQESVAQMAGQVEKTSSSLLWVPVQPNLKPLDPPMEHQAAWEVARASFSKLVAPLGIPIFVGPGSISTTIIYASEARDRITMLGLVGVLGAASLIVLVCLLLSEWIEQAISDTGLDIAIRIFGLLLAAIGIQFMLSGLSEATVNFINPEIIVVKGISISFNFP